MPTQAASLRGPQAGIASQWLLHADGTWARMIYRRLISAVGDVYQPQTHRRRGDYRAQALFDANGRGAAAVTTGGRSTQAVEQWDSHIDAAGILRALGCGHWIGD